MSEEVPAADGALSYDPPTDTYRATFKHGEMAPSMAVVHLMAGICEEEPTALKPLNEVVDVDALDQFIRPQQADAQTGDRSASFPYYGHDVTVRSYGLVKATPVTADGEAGGPLET